MYSHFNIYKVHGKEQPGPGTQLFICWHTFHWPELSPQSSNYAESVLDVLQHQPSKFSFTNKAVENQKHY